MPIILPGLHNIEEGVATGLPGGNDANTKLLLHFNGSDASTTFTDSSAFARTATVGGNAQIDTAQSKFGGASGLFDGTGDYISFPDSTDWDFGTGDFTFDFWVRYNSVVISTFFDNYGTSNGIFLILLDANTIRADVGSDTSKTFAWSPSTGVWYHLAFVRTSGTLRMFVNGAQVGSDIASTANVSGSTSAMFIGRRNTDIQGLNGWLDEFRISNVARWTAAFTPPSSPYS